MVAIVITPLVRGNWIDGPVEGMRVGCSSWNALVSTSHCLRDVITITGTNRIFLLRIAVSKLVKLHPVVGLDRFIGGCCTTKTGWTIGRDMVAVCVAPFIGTAVTNTLVFGCIDNRRSKHYSHANKAKAKKESRFHYHDCSQQNESTIA